jgi:methylated-DNA-[protein]-cysteine S-methyltransferase
MKALLDIPYGKTRTYLEQSKTVSDAKAIRAVASANGKNPLWIVVPCHRVMVLTVRSLDMQADCGVKVAIGTRKPTTQQSLF